LINIAGKRRRLSKAEQSKQKSLKTTARNGQDGTEACKKTLNPDAARPISMPLNPGRALTPTNSKRKHLD
tara:strand:+ start:409 stop:618 length:210 start_codon:yes stop_codon:yes gene_type:complete